MHLPSPMVMLILAVLAVFFFGGGGKIQSVMSDFAKGIKAFKKGMAEDDDDKAKPAEAPKAIDTREKV